MLNHPAIILLAAVLLDAILGDPYYPFHPVRLMGKWIARLDPILRNPVKHGRRISGGLLVLLVIGAALLTYEAIIRMIPPAYHAIPNILLVYTLLALQDMIRHVQRVCRALAEHDLAAARNAVQQIVGRDATQLDPDAIARATIESLAENFVDGFLSSVFWFAIGSLVGGPAFGVRALIIFKAASTLDSMVGYRNDTYRDFGYCSAKLDDILNFIPARICIPLITLSAFLLRQDPTQTWRIGLRDRLQHASPNSAHAEAAIAGALNLKLGGPTTYPWGTIQKPWLGNGSTSPSPTHIRKAIHLIFLSSLIATLLTSLCLW